MTTPTFAEFYEAVHGVGRTPFPWQVRLADEVLQGGWERRLLDLPTGSGKTSVLDVALYCLACAPDRMPRRTLLVVDRRIVVDQGAAHARKLRDALQKATAGPAHEIANALRAMAPGSAEEPCVEVAVLRGGMPRDNDWARRPDRPLLGVSTVDQVGSRLLFRGYGVSAMSASIYAGLIGNDTLILLDEVHLAIPFANTLDAVHGRFRTGVPGLPDRFAVVQMSATVGATSTPKSVFRLSAEDERHPVLAQRLGANKLAQLELVKVTGDDEDKKRRHVAQQAVDHALALQRAGARVVAIVVNRVDTARHAIALLRQSHATATDSLLVTGRMRPIDRDRVVRRELNRASADRTRSATDSPLVVVATQCIEAGADLDFDGLVTECASLDALRQRFGRVDRRGLVRETRSIILGRSDLVAEAASDPIYGIALSATWSWLSVQRIDRHVDFGIRALPPAVTSTGAPMTDLLPPVLDAPVMLPAHLDAWAQTSIPPEPDADISAWLHGPQRPTAEVQVVWRVIGSFDAAVPVDQLEARLMNLLEAVRPSSLESISIPIAAAKAWLRGSENVPIADVISGEIVAEETNRRRPAATGPHVAFRWRGDGSELVTVESIRPGDVLVVDVARGGLRHDSFDPDAMTNVLDVGDLAQLRARGLPTLRLDRAALSMWALPGKVLEALPVREADEPLPELAERARAWVASWPEVPPADFIGTAEEWTRTRTHLSSRRARVREAGDGAILTAKLSEHDRQHTRDNTGDELTDMLTEGDDSSFRAVEVSLAVHSTDVRTLAEAYGRALGFGREIVEDLALAGWLHDVGKADPRFQRWLVGGDEIRAASTDVLLAKSALPPGSRAQRRAARERAGYPRGYRHELLSLAMASANAEVLGQAHDPALVLHLVASHHGWCRPFAPPVDHPDDVSVSFVHGQQTLAATTRHQLARLDHGVVDRYWDVSRRYGWWGLAWLESILRLADHRASEQEQDA